MFTGFRGFLERKLYHGTVADNEPTIRKFGLEPGVGDFTRDAYGDDYADEFDSGNDAVYMADKRDIKKATTAMVSQIALKLKKSPSDVTDTDLVRYGLLCVTDDPDHRIQQVDDSGSGDHPRFAEPYDYYSRDRVVPDKYIAGNGLVRFLKAYGAFPVTWALKTPSQKELDYSRGKLVAHALRAHPGKDVRGKVAELSGREVETMLKRYRQSSPRGY